MSGRSLFGAVALTATIVVAGCTDSTAPASGGSANAPPRLDAAATETVCKAIGSSTDPKYREITVHWRAVSGLTRRGTSYVASYFRPCPPPPDGYAPLFLCNATNYETLVGTSINFLIDGTRTEALTTAAGQGAANCINLGNYAVGASVTLQEQVPAGIQVDFASFSYNPPGGLTSYNSATALATVVIGPVTNVFAFYNRPATP